MSSLEVTDLTGTKGSVPTCEHCQSLRVVRDAYAEWDSAEANWVIQQVFELSLCRECDQQTAFVWKLRDHAQVDRIRYLNDRFRINGQGQGTILLTQGIQALDKSAQVDVIHAVQTFTDFSEDNDPYGEHDFGAVTVSGEKIFWKLDYYDRTQKMGSPNPAYEELTHRVLTVMLASEY